jgi:predicted enzyme related to lactoylglutathione lyase
VPPDCPFGIAIVPAPKGVTVGAVGPILYFACEDPQELAARIVKAGGLMRFGPSKLFGYGEIWQLEDPSGIRWGLYRKARP